VELEASLGEPEESSTMQLERSELLVHNGESKEVGGESVTTSTRGLGELDDAPDWGQKGRLLVILLAVERRARRTVGFLNRRDVCCRFSTICGRLSWLVGAGDDAVGAAAVDVAGDDDDADDVGADDVAVVADVDADVAGAGVSLPLLHTAGRNRQIRISLTLIHASAFGVASANPGRASTRHACPFLLTSTIRTGVDQGKRIFLGFRFLTKASCPTWTFISRLVVSTSTAFFSAS